MDRRTTLITLAITVVCAFSAVAQNNYPPPKGQRAIDAHSRDALDIHFCTPQARLPAGVYDRTLAQEIAEGVAAGLAARTQPDPDCLARARARHAPVVASTVYAVNHNPTGRIILYTGGTHDCGAANPFVSQDIYGGIAYGCWSAGHDVHGRPGYHYQSEYNPVTGTRSKRGIWGIEQFTRQGR